MNVVRLGQEDNDMVRGNAGINPISGGTGNDVFVWNGPGDEGDNADAGGGSNSSPT